ncbi:hypothetical protein [Acetobacter oryzifermentans]|uniref:Uncharacterized protein n=1 Tax=Acetobacter oryzifermentans TaxID=1633874 RepID=A0ABN4NLX4_9PROT|nr:hypothetical protein [Acetobacter oryzifermentans]ANA12910.1 hypothetical protein WG31_01840 [Acetobacter oryzifermentans]
MQSAIKPRSEGIDPKIHKYLIVVRLPPLGEGCPHRAELHQYFAPGPCGEWLALGAAKRQGLDVLSIHDLGEDHGKTDDFIKGLKEKGVIQ